MSSHFRGADNPNWAFTKDTEKLINQQEKKMKLTSKVRADFRFFSSPFNPYLEIVDKKSTNTLKFLSYFDVTDRG